MACNGPGRNAPRAQVRYHDLAHFFSADDRTHAGMGRIGVFVTMSLISNVILVVAALLLTTMGACANEVPAELDTLPYVASPEPNVITAGRVRAEDIGMIAAAGIRHVVDLSLEAETPDFDEARASQQAGMQYHALPVRGAVDLGRAQVERFDALMRHTAGEPTLVHCASSNRVGALAALRAAWILGLSDEDAIDIGRSWGLRGLEPAVRERLQQAPRISAE